MDNKIWITKMDNKMCNTRYDLTTAQIIIFRK